MYFKARNAASPRHFDMLHRITLIAPVKIANSNDISDLLGILTSRLEWPEARISVEIPRGIPLRHTVAIGDRLQHLSQSIGLEILMR